MLFRSPSPLSGLLKAVADHSDPGARDAAFAELLRLVGIYVRAGMGRGLRARRESMDVCQSVAKSFIDDMRMPGMLNGAVVMTEHPRAKILSIDTSAAEQERIAREEFGMVRGGKEVLYRFYGGDSAAPKVEKKAP